MARPIKENLDYFQVDVAIYGDDKIILAQELIDPMGTEPWLRFAVPAIAIRMLREIYNESYFIEWNDKVIMIKSAKMESVITMIVLKKIVDCLLQSGFFSMELFNKCGVLTSHGIQERWFFIQKNSNRSKAIIRDDIKLYSEVIHIRKSNLPKKQGFLPQETTPNEQETTPNEQESTHKKVYSLSNSKGNTKSNTNNTNSVNNINKNGFLPQETTSNEQETTSNEQETTSNEQETTSNEQETTSNEQETTNFIKNSTYIPKWTPEFDAVWINWEKYLFEQHQFKFKGMITRQASLEELVKLSDFSESAAIGIIKNSISKGWRHFYQSKGNDPKKPEKKGTGTGYPTAQELLAKREAGNGKIPQVG